MCLSANIIYKENVVDVDEDDGDDDDIDDEDLLTGSSVGGGKEEQNHIFDMPPTRQLVQRSPP